jgi:tagaturonate epimerase
MDLEKLSFGVGDRFAHQAKAQLRAFRKARELGIDLVLVWNKSHREHTFGGSEPSSATEAAKAAVEAANWRHGWHVGADHIQLKTLKPIHNLSRVEGLPENN